MSGRLLSALINKAEIGILREVSGLWSFQYTQEWLNDPQSFALSPHIPLSG